MALLEHLPLLLVVALATYAQTITGFAFGLIFMAGLMLFGIAPVAFGAILISILSLFNCGVALYGKRANLDRQVVLLSTLSGLVTVFLGVWALNALSGGYVDWLQVILGVGIIISSLMLVRHPKPRDSRSPRWTFALFGGLSGFMGGMFSTSGPPLVFHLYRQPLNHEVIRDCLLLIFAINSIQRLAIVGVQGAVTLDVLVLAGLSVPVVLLFTWLGRQYPPPLSTRSIRRVAFVLLMGSGFSLCLSGLS
ncbi:MULTISPECIES: sulfite exporter TauE/SafE family protein [Halomonadaceae]|uniref:sulfite exporter TauE/SafE family protein n=1 Tax=Halomonadaceae TaxID=28256 RepID=UPI0012F41C8A|nr:MULTISPECIES: sulfite exporter TauE/SafE family protein [Halomonas]CAD5262432.1 putative sulfite/organosulfonate exporter TauE [Halomonas sp. 113]CAD5264229.1 putative sulfite/organosulfonate exporter TauE [Halomonas sp. 59]CAD5277113.1 putative sulfite/organosulfonate exporter TauE [Halomonas sp. I3]CAD5285926.1 putative sulfite/organosulfonate exporter TauE [Halomonas sp. 156]VXB49404.1 putative sulfite/organosulfonate exporter TauE [Halomonas titanicae]